MTNVCPVKNLDCRHALVVLGIIGWGFPHSLWNFVKQKSVVAFINYKLANFNKLIIETTLTEKCYRK
jgi:hypothetical protein